MSHPRGREPSRGPSHCKRAALLIHCAVAVDACSPSPKTQDTCHKRHSGCSYYVVRDSLEKFFWKMILSDKTWHLLLWKIFCNYFCYMRPSLKTRDIKIITWSYWKWKMKVMLRFTWRVIFSLKQGQISWYTRIIIRYFVVFNTVILKEGDIFKTPKLVISDKNIVAYPIGLWHSEFNTVESWRWSPTFRK